MKKLGLGFVGVLALGATSAEAAFSCGNVARDIEALVRDSSRASGEVSQEIRILGRLADSLRDAAQALNGGGAAGIDLQRELSTPVSSASRRGSEAANATARETAELRRTPGDSGLGSEAFRIATRVGQALEGSVRGMVSDAGNRVGAIKDKVSRLHDQLGNNGSMENIKAQLVQQLRRTDRVQRSVLDLSNIARLDNRVRRYTSSCSNSADFSCGSIRSTLESSADRAASAGRPLERLSSDLSRAVSQAERIVGDIRPGASVDLNATLNEFIDRNVLPPIQDAYNRVSEAGRLAREAGVASSGVLFDQLAREGVRQGEAAAQSFSAFESSISNLEREIERVQRLLNQGGGNSQPVVRDLRESAREVSGLEQAIGSISQGLGSGGWNSSGDLSRVEQSLSEHRRRCELL